MAAVTASSRTHHQPIRHRADAVDQGSTPSVPDAGLLRALIHAGAFLDPSGMLAVQLFCRMTDDDRRRAR